MSPRATRIVLVLLLSVAGGARLFAEPVGREVTIDAFDSEKFLPQVAYNGLHQEFFVVWHQLLGSGVREIRGARLDRLGQVLTTFTLATGARSRAQPAVAYDSLRDRYLVVYIYDYHGNGSDWDLFGRLVPWNGPDPALGELIIYNETDSQWNPRVAYSSGDDEFLVVWGNTPSSANASVSYRYVLPDGVPDFAQTLASDATHNYTNPGLAYNQFRDEYLVAYEVDGVDVASRRLDHTGFPLGSQVLVADWPDAEGRPAVAACPGRDQWLVVWQNSDPNIYARFLTGSGALDGSPLAVALAPGADDNVAVTCLPGADQYLATWEGEYSTGVSGILGRRIGADRSFLAPEFAVRVVFSVQARSARTSAVAAARNQWSVVWVQEREGSTYSDIHGAVVWSLVVDDFERGNLAMWSVVSP